MPHTDFLIWPRMQLTAKSWRLQKRREAGEERSAVRGGGGGGCAVVAA